MSVAAKRSLFRVFTHSFIHWFSIGIKFVKQFLTLSPYFVICSDPIHFTMQYFTSFFKLISCIPFAIFVLFILQMLTRTYNSLDLNLFLVFNWRHVSMFFWRSWRRRRTEVCPSLARATWRWRGVSDESRTALTPSQSPAGRWSPPPRMSLIWPVNLLFLGFRGTVTQLSLSYFLIWKYACCEKTTLFPLILKNSESDGCFLSF